MTLTLAYSQPCADAMHALPAARKIDKAQREERTRKGGKERISASPPQLTNGVSVVSGTKKKRPGAASAEASSKGSYPCRSSNKGAAGSKALPEITVFDKAGGPLTKRISLNADGSINTDGSACVMSRGKARRAKVADVHALAALIERLKPYQAIALGVFRDGLPDQVRIVTKDRLNGVTQPNIIARSSDYIVYRPRRQAFALIDFDSKGMPRKVAARIKKAGGLWPALLSVMPELADVARVVRRSTSAGLFNRDTGKKIKGSGGVHIYLAVANGLDVERFLKVLHDRCWLAGFGWMMIGTGGQILERSIIDRSVVRPSASCSRAPRS